MGVLKKRTFDCINVDIDKDSNVCQESVTFIIPYLQRAYKWKEKQAKQMLEDFSEFLKQEKTYYCMQPLAVVKIGDNKYELLDGQQRLTTLLILWRILFESDEKTSYPYKFEYERDSSESNTLINRYSFITESDEIKKGEYGNIDEYYMSKVYGAIKLYFDNPNNKKTDEQKADNYKETFKKLLKGEGKHILFLWYEVNEEEKHTTFAHLNSGKIELTCSELIKAILLSDGNKESLDNNRLPDKSLVAAQYAEMEEAFNDDRLWYMLQTDEPLYNGSRMDLLFNMVLNINRKAYEADPKAAFYKVYARRADLSRFWKDCRAYFVRIMDLYKNPYTYHYIGYLTYTEGNNKIDDWVKVYKESGLKGCIEQLKSKVRESISGLGDLEKITYSDTSKATLRKIFILHNIQTILIHYETIKKANLGLRFSYEQFPFELLYSQRWDIEHIASQTENPLTKIQDCKDWIASVRADYSEIFVQRPDLNNEIDLFEKDSKIEMFKQIYNEIVSSAEKNSPQNKDGLGNLVLLDSHTNRSYHNSLYKRKRKIILAASNIDNQNNEYQVTYIPRCTLNVFLKTYNTGLDVKLGEWTQDDYDKYLGDLKEKLEQI
ncbi:DUF262 domain-containing protein [Phocaeicola coprocola]|jgi:hypothetical protein|uniref:DUF262 domain-containing protein n=1 Tax=Phocaeicola coprocola TaxID=310298 RepID=UPI0021FE6BE7|nr:DUF262 domain-containing protein [Phocaeicola coprocola]UWD54243.1 MAG: Protein of unknown function DUF262 [Bacteriophage sp.]